MPEPDDTLEDENENDDDLQNLTPERLKEIRGAANRAAKNKAEAEAAKAEATKLARENAFIKAGVDTDHPLVKRLMDGFEGELTKEGVTAYLEEMQVTSLLAAPTTQTTPAADDPNLTPEERAQAAERQRLAGEGEPPAGDNGEHPAVAGLGAAFEIIEKGGSREDGASAFFNKLFEGAVKGDQRVLTANQGGGYVQQ